MEKNIINNILLSDKKDAFKRNLRMDILYNGYSFHGWQVQGNLRTVQGEIEKELKQILQEDNRLYGASRTDAKVHAKGMVANYFTNSDKPCDDLMWALNKRLSKDISIKNIYDVSHEFDARRSAKGKYYKYRVWVSYEKPVFDSDFVYWFPCKNLNVEKMIESSKYFIGYKDYSSFASNRGCKDEIKMRNVTDVQIVYNYPIIEFNVFGESFLYKMVRGISGTLLEIGLGKALDVEEIFNFKDRSTAGRNLPGHGLFLMEVFY